MAPKAKDLQILGKFPPKGLIVKMVNLQNFGSAFTPFATATGTGDFLRPSFRQSAAAMREL
jgi:hypothetical protein